MEQPESKGSKDRLLIYNVLNFVPTEKPVQSN